MSSHILTGEMLVQQPINSNQITLSSSQKAYYAALKNLNNQTEDEKYRKRYAQSNYAKQLMQKIDEKPTVFCDQSSNSQNDSLRTKQYTFGVLSKNDAISQLNESSHKKVQLQFNDHSSITEADLSQFDSCSSNSTNKNSPFMRSCVPTPPLGFSMRSHQLKLPSSTQAQKNYMTKENPKPTNIYNESPLKPNVNILQKVPGIFKPTEPKLLESKSILLETPPFMPKESNCFHLSTKSELVYPDGHFSPITTQRDS